MTRFQTSWAQWVVVLLALWSVSSTTRAAPPAPQIVGTPKSTKICQLVGECDRQAGGPGACTHGLLGQPTINLTESRYGLFGTDLGASFEHKGRIYFLFGDTIPSGFNPPPTARPNDSDSIAYSEDANPEDCVSLQFVTAADGYYQPPQIQIPPGDAAAPVTLGSYETPMGGFSASGNVYVFFTTDAMVSASAITLGRSVLAKSVDDAHSFTHVYDVSTSTFINIAPVVVNNADIPGLPRSAGSGLLLWASGTQYRKSDPYLAYVPLDHVEDHTAWLYFAGYRHGRPSWSRLESAAVPLFSTTPCIGELSVTWNPLLRKWLIFYNCDAPRGINVRAASLPWGPWSDVSVVFNPVSDGGYCHFIHWSDAVSPTPLGGSAPCDNLSDPGANNIFGGEYGPYVIARYTTADANSTTMYYAMSTFNPYTAVLMKTTLRTACTTSPATGCRKPTATGSSTVDLKRNANSGKDVLTWTWSKGAATSVTDFGDPVTGSSNYSLCMYDGTPSLALSVTAAAQAVCGTKPCWSGRAMGFKYADKSLTSDGLQQVQLTAGVDGKAKLLVKAVGANLPLPALPLNQAAPIVVQLQNSEGGCWEADYSAPATKNDAAEFKDKSD